MASKDRPITVQNTENSTQLAQIVGIKKLSILLGVSLATCRRWEKAGILPPAIRASKKEHRRWKLSEVQKCAAAAGLIGGAQ